MRPVPVGRMVVAATRLRAHRVASGGGRGIGGAEFRWDAWSLRRLGSGRTGLRPGAGEVSAVRSSGGAHGRCGDSAQGAQGRVGGRARYRRCGVPVGRMVVVATRLRAHRVASGGGRGIGGAEFRWGAWSLWRLGAGRTGYRVASGGGRGIGGAEFRWGAWSLWRLGAGRTGSRRGAGEVSAVRSSGGAHGRCGDSAQGAQGRVRGWPKIRRRGVPDRVWTVVAWRLRRDPSRVELGVMRSVRSVSASSIAAQGVRVR
ncbi:hypothetical protein DFR70_11015 [Nocardia tenerifensis]|uniref:Uncharacterized protein n=1 Tax=Nocardia tenerifensis TaxID=228006 RepID=A0A318K079_9NOCA|nr:hypothetical protein DFR70_11015 [Nocardia tenerifensis]